MNIHQKSRQFFLSSCKLGISNKRPSYPLSTHFHAFTLLQVSSFSSNILKMKTKRIERKKSPRFFAKYIKKDSPHFGAFGENFETILKEGLNN